MDTASTSGFVSSGNILDPRLVFGNTSNLTLAQVAHRDRRRSRQFIGDPDAAPALFTNYGANDYTLAASSAAIDAGLSGLLYVRHFFRRPGRRLAGRPPADRLRF